jgi:acyl carrier protein
LDDLEQRLIRAFRVTFPGLGEHDVRQADAASVAGWDSIATVTLINVVEEELGIQIDVEDIEDFMSFRRFYDYLQTRLA